MALLAAATAVREQAYAPLFPLQGRRRDPLCLWDHLHRLQRGNEVFPEGTCAEAGAIVAVVTAAETVVDEGKMTRRLAPPAMAL